MSFRFLPPFYPEHLPVSLTDAGATEGTKVCCTHVVHWYSVASIFAQEETKRLDLCTWQVAYDRYALAAQITGQLSFRDAMVHKSVVLEVAANAKSVGRRPLLGVVYDEVARFVCSPL